MLSLPKFCDRGILLERGRITDEGTPQQVVHNYLARVEALLALPVSEQQELKMAQAASG
jgi:ABC-type polysaccharide/polyol phosphate transport system ATPase subunit